MSTLDQKVQEVELAMYAECGGLDLWWALDERGLPVPTQEPVERNESGNIGKCVINGVRVSTVFLGSNHRIVPGELPILFETMIFNGPLDEYQCRYHTRAEAEEGHHRAVEIVQVIADGADPDVMKARWP